MRVLVVDDEATVRVVLRIKLETMGWCVDEARSGDEALARCRKAPPDAVVLDHRMRGRTGLDVAKVLREEGYAGTILLYSAYVTPSLQADARAAGLVAVPKTQFADVVQLLQRAAEGVEPSGADG
jgi:CheY-like chemotaxis protein